MLRKTVCFGVCALLAAATFGAPLTAGLHEGRIEIPADADANVYDFPPVSGSIGYFPVDNLEIGAIMGFRKSNKESYWVNGSVWELGVFGEYHMDVDFFLQPYVGARAVQLDGEEDDDNVNEMAAYVGVKAFLTEQVAVSVAVAQQWADEELYDISITGRNAETDTLTQKGDKTATVIRVGLRCYF